MDLNSSGSVLWKNSISHVFTKFCTFSSSDQGGPYLQQQLQQQKTLN